MAGRPHGGRRRAFPARFSARQPAPGERGRFGMPGVMVRCAEAKAAGSAWRADGIQAKIRVPCATRHGAQGVRRGDEWVDGMKRCDAGRGYLGWLKSLRRPDGFTLMLLKTIVFDEIFKFPN